MQLRVKTFFLLIILGLISGCSRYIDYAKKTFDQACSVDLDLSKARSYIRSEKVYDQLTTVGLFDALWVNKDVQDAYRKIKLERSGVLDTTEQKKLEAELEQYNQFTTFYLLLPPKDAQDVGYMHFDGVTYFNNNIDWKVFLEVGGKKYSPVEFTNISELSPEFSLIFGRTSTRYRSIYIAKFKPEDNYSGKLKLVIRTTKYTVQLCW